MSNFTGIHYDTCIYTTNRAMDVKFQADVIKIPLE